jgi:hypothetical protein
MKMKNNYEKLYNTHTQTHPENEKLSFVHKLKESILLK